MDVRVAFAPHGELWQLHHIADSAMAVNRFDG
jgi:hypothetical protein